MSTGSTISIKRKDGTTTSIYCHFDGYIEGVGVTLQLAYNTADKVEELLKLGDLSILGYYTNPDPDKEHSFDGERQPDVCVAYHRDRGEEFRQSSGLAEFNYTFDENEACWYVKEEIFSNNTQATKLLSLEYICTYKEKLLLDAIIKSDVDSCGWRDDEFAESGKVVQACIKKAIEAREKIISEKEEEYDSYYRAYCD